MPLPQDLLEKHNNQCFVETGTHHGAGIYAAINCNFPKIRSIEFDDALYHKCKMMFRSYDNVKIYRGSSATRLGEMVDSGDRCSFWLDAHYSGRGTSFDGKYSPLMEELDQISKLEVKTHTILIDDRRLYGTTDDSLGIPFPEITESMIFEKLLGINQEYEIVFEDSTDFKKDIIVAYIPKDE